MLHLGRHHPRQGVRFSQIIVIIVKLDEPTKLFFFLVIIISNMSFTIYWIIMMYFELKSMIIKKFASIYLFLCLCGNREKLIKLEEEILVKEENEVLREKYLEILG